MYQANQINLLCTYLGMFCTTCMILQIRRSGYFEYFLLEKVFLFAPLCIVDSIMFTKTVKKW
jgi:hypothetical protein